MPGAWYLDLSVAQAPVQHVAPTGPATEWVPVEEDAQHWPLSLWLGAGLIFGSLVAMLIWLRGLWRLNRWFRDAQPAEEPPVPQLVLRLAAQLGLSNPPTIRWTARIQSPLSWGLWPGRVLLPGYWRHADDQQLAHGLGHELAHVRRLDWTWLLLAQLLRCLYWWNPLAHSHLRRLESDTESACDELVVRRMASRKNYAQTLLRLAASPQATGALCMSGQSPVAMRIQSLLSSPDRRIPMNRVERNLLPLCLVAILIPLVACRVGVAAEPAPDVTPVPAAAEASEAPKAPAGPVSAAVPAAAPRPDAPAPPAIPRHSDAPRAELAREREQMEARRAEMARNAEAMKREREQELAELERHLAEVKREEAARRAELAKVDQEMAQLKREMEQMRARMEELEQEAEQP